MFLAEAGYDPNFGARPLKRVLQNRVETPIAHEIIRGNFKQKDMVSVSVKNGELFFKKK